MNKKGCFIGPKISKPMQSHQIINPRPRGKENTMGSISLTAAVDEAVAKEIKTLKTKVQQLEAKIKRKDITISNLKRGASFSKDNRNALLLAVEDLVSELQDKDWIEIDRYYDDGCVYR